MPLTACRGTISLGTLPYTRKPRNLAARYLQGEQVRVVSFPIAISDALIFITKHPLLSIANVPALCLLLEHVQSSTSV